MSNLYLVRHGQAGTRDDYDSLSELGKQQTRLLGEYFHAQGIEFTAVYVGSMQRQQQTAEAIKNVFAQNFPEVSVDEQWNEFDLTDIYRETAPLLCEVDPNFRDEYEAMRREVADGDEKVHRQWRPCDTRVVDAWVAGEVPYSGETWTGFCDRVSSRLDQIKQFDRHANVLVCTSATPTAVLTGNALDIDRSRVRQLAGVLYNSSFTVLHQREDLLRLFQFNAVPHLNRPELRTHR